MMGGYLLYLGTGAGGPGGPEVPLEQGCQSIPLLDAKAEYKIILKLVEGQELEDP